jgi:hypothetical protein
LEIKIFKINAIDRRLTRERKENGITVSGITSGARRGKDVYHACIHTQVHGMNAIRKMIAAARSSALFANGINVSAATENN